MHYINPKERCKKKYSGIKKKTKNKKQCIIKFKFQPLIRNKINSDMIMVKKKNSAFSYSLSVCNIFHNPDFHERNTILLWEYIYLLKYYKTHTRGIFCRSVQGFNHSQISEIYVFNVGLYSMVLSLLSTQFLMCHETKILQ